MGLRFILNGRIIDDGETSNPEVINTPAIGAFPPAKMTETDHSQDQDIQNLIRARNMGDTADAKQQAQNNAAQASATNLQPITSDVVTKATGYWAVKTNTSR